jgi:hypothetical protein
MGASAEMDGMPVEADQLGENEVLQKRPVSRRVNSDRVSGLGAMTLPRTAGA